MQDWVVMQDCVILAGGKSSRMGQDKTLMEFGGFSTLTHFQVDKFSQIFQNVFVSSKFDKFNPPLSLIKDDRSDDFSPMLALYSILSNFTNKSVFIIPADMPFVSKECVLRLFEFVSEFDIVIPEDNFHTHSLCGFFSSNLADKARELYENGEHKIGLLHKSCRCKKVKFDDEREFFNINYFSDYKEAIKANL